MSFLRPTSHFRVCPTLALRCSSPSIIRTTSLTAFRRHCITPSSKIATYHRISRTARSLSTSTMSFSNTDTPPDKPADPYKATNKDEPDLKEKVEDLSNFVSSCKFGMMTTRIGSSGLLTSRCMALAAKVGQHHTWLHHLCH